MSIGWEEAVPVDAMPVGAMPMGAMPVGVMPIDAIVLAGGRSSRLGGVAKAELIYEGESLVSRTLGALSRARTVVLVGDAGGRALPDRVLAVRENPPFGGPAAAIAAGVDALAEANQVGSEFTVVLACDMPEVEVVTRTFLDALPSDSSQADAVGDGLIGVDAAGRLQPLAAVYRSERLAAAIAERQRSGTLNGLSVFALISGLALTSVLVPEGATDDVDTWDDAEKFGIRRPEQAITGGEKMNDREEDDATLEQWYHRLEDALELDGLALDINAVLGLAGRAAHAVIRPAAPLTTFVAGYAAGLAVGRGQALPDAAIMRATDVALRLCREEAPKPDSLQ